MDLENIMTLTCINIYSRIRYLII